MKTKTKEEKKKKRISSQISNGVGLFGSKDMMN